MSTEEQTSNDGFLLADNFDAADYVHEFLKNVRGGDEVRKLSKLRSSLDAANTSSSEAIKDIVFERYRQFIDTSKEVSQLEREIYQLSSLLMDQKNLIESMMEQVGQEKRIAAHSANAMSANSSQFPIQVLMQKIEGISSVLNNLQESDRVVLQSEMTLLDSDSMEARHAIFLVLLNDSIVIGYPSESNKYRFQLHSTHSLDNLAVVNVKRTAGRHTTGDQILQLLIFPDQLYVKCNSARVKREWLEGVEQAKRKQQQEHSLVRQATIRAKRRSVAGPHPTVGKSFGGIEAISEEAAPETELEQKTAEADLEWLNELVDEVYDVIARREMSAAVELINEWKEAKCQDVAINNKWKAVERTVIKMLSDEVRSPGALHGGSQGLQRNMDLLSELGKSAYAMDLLLKRHSKALKHAASELAVSEEPLSYVRQVSTLFVNAILEVANGAMNKPASLCQMLQFASGELKLLLSLVRRNVIEVAPSMAVLAHTWRILLDQCRRLADAGLDLSFEVHRLLAPSLQAALESNFSNIFDAVCLRVKEERWRVYNLESELNQQRYLEEMSDLGFNLEPYVGNRHTLNLASSACQFSRVAHALSRDLGLLNSSHLDDLCDGFVTGLWKEFLSFLVESNRRLKAAASNTTALNVHANTCQFIVSEVLPLCEEAYFDGCQILTGLLAEEFPSLGEYVVERSEDSFEEEIANV